jgi:hypothetical protein
MPAHTTRATPLTLLTLALLTACSRTPACTVPMPGTEPPPTAFVRSPVALPNIPAREFVATTVGADSHILLTTKPVRTVMGGRDTFRRTP